MILWFIGLSGSGKSTVGSIVYEKIKAKHSNTVLLDGDVMREVWGDTLGHTIEAREKNAMRISYLSQFLNKQNINVVAAVLSIFPEWQKWNRENLSNYIQIHLDTPLNVVKNRDSKGLYAAAAKGNNPNMVGIDIPFPQPYQSDMTVSTPDILEPAVNIAEKVLAFLNKRGEI